MKLKFFILGILFTLVIISLAYGSYYLGKKSKKSSFTATPTPFVSPFYTVTPTPSKNSTETVKQAVSEAVTTQNFTDLEKYLANPVSFRIENSGCCSPQSPKDAIAQLAYLNSSKGTWDFNSCSCN